MKKVSTPVRSGENRRSTVAGMLAGKSTKDSVNYRMAPHGAKECCMECQYYESPQQSASSCSKVAGLVEAMDICDLYESRKSNNSDNSGTKSIVINVNL